MIVAGILEKLFNGMTLTYNEYSSTLKSYKVVTKPVQYHYGDNKELAKWIRGRSGKQKYPLIWYVLDPVDNSSGDTLTAKCTLLLFTSTKTEYYNNTRALINYSNILEPLTVQIYRKLESTNAISLLFKDYEDVYSTFDIPNYGVDLDVFDFTSNLPKGTEGVTIDIVDARRMEFQGRFVKNANITGCV